MTHKLRQTCQARTGVCHQIVDEFPYVQHISGFHRALFFCFLFDLQDKTSPPLGYLPAQAHGSESVSGMKSQHTVLQPPPLPDSPPGQQAEGSDSAGGMISRHAVTWLGWLMAYLFPSSFRSKHIIRICALATPPGHEFFDVPGVTHKQAYSATLSAAWNRKKLCSENKSWK